MVAYNSLMDVEDMPGTVSEASRVLIPGGRFCMCVTHPMADAGTFEAREPGAAFIVRGRYLGRRPFEETFERAGLTMTFSGWAYPLEDYAEALRRAGFLLEVLKEPPAPSAAIEKDPAEERWARIPLFLFARAIKK